MPIVDAAPRSFADRFCFPSWFRKTKDHAEPAKTPATSAVLGEDSAHLTEEVRPLLSSVDLHDATGIVVGALAIDDQKTLRATNKAWRNFIRFDRFRVHRPQDAFTCIQRFPQMSSLEISNCETVPHFVRSKVLTGLMNALASCTTLKSLKIASAYYFDGTHLAALRHLPLECLALPGTYLLEDQDLACLAQMPLRELELGSCDHLTEKAVSHLARLPLESLHISCFGIQGKLGGLAPASLKRLTLHRANYLLSNDELAMLQIPNIHLRDKYRPQSAAYALDQLPNCKSVETISPVRTRNHSHSNMPFRKEIATRQCGSEWIDV